MSENDTQYAPVEVEDELLRDGFCAIPMHLIDDHNVCPAAKVTYGVMYYYFVRFHGFPGQSELARRVGISERSMRDHISELKSAGYIDMVRQAMGKPSKLVLKSFYGRTTDSQANTSAPSGGLFPDSQANIASPSGGTLPNRQEAGFLTSNNRDSEEGEGENTCARPPVCAGSTATSSSCENANTRTLTPIQQAIQDAYNAFPLEGIATDPPGAKRKQYSRLPQKINEKGLPLLREWIEWLKQNPQEVVEGADPWTYFVGRFVAALGRPWEWQGKTSYNNAPKPAVAPALPANLDELPLAKRLEAQFIAENGTEPTFEDATMLDSEPWWRWRKALREFQQANGADLPAEMGEYTGMRPSEVREKHGDKAADLLIKIGW